ncbi:unnamed protein product [Brachionus calyciflorus]|uniref:Uncharacterized protein n=1 Tax=Brachionus calyciflorus TaxID=104777 RepID=A0A813TQQ5_9BILA|nr:unnamed protein product [Brachionus calyciflorus]
MLLQFLIISLILIFKNVSLQSLHSSFDLYDTADLILNVNTQNNLVHIEAFKSKNNNFIIENKITERYSHLKWVSMGYPRLTLRNRFENSTLSQIFEMKPQGFDIFIETLTNQHRVEFTKLIKETYNIDVKPHQILSLVPTKFDCKIELFSKGQKILFTGRAIKMNTSPIRVMFSAPKQSSQERTIFDQYLKNYGNTVDFDIDCTVSLSKKEIKETRLILDQQQIIDLGIIEKLLGDKKVRYVLRNQIAQLSNELYKKLNIFEKYEISKEEFSERFSDDFIQQTSQNGFTTVGFFNALWNLSSYNFEEELESLKKRIVSFFTNISDNSAQFSNEEFDKINNQTSNDIIWNKKEDVMYPEIIRIPQISKSLLSKNLSFLLKSDYFDKSVFKRSYLLNTKLIQNQELTLNASKQSIIEEPEKSEIIKSYFTMFNKFREDLNKSRDNIVLEILNLTLNNIPTDFVPDPSNEELVRYSFYNEKNDRRYFLNKTIIRMIYRQSLEYNQILSFKILPDGNLATGCEDGTIKIWNLDDGSLIKTMEGHFGPVYSLVVLKDGNLASCSRDYTINIWNHNDGSLLKTIFIENLELCKMAVLPDGNLAVRNNDILTIWDPYNELLIGSITDRLSRSDPLIFLSDGNFAYISEDETIKKVTYNNSLKNSKKTFIKCETKPKTWLLIKSYRDIIIKIKRNYEEKENVFSNNFNLTFSDEYDSYYSFAVLSNGYLASGSQSDIKIWNADNGSLIRIIPGHSGRVLALTVLQNGNLASCSEDKTIKIWDANFGSLKITINGHSDRVNTLVVLPNGNLASGSDDKTIKIWNPNNGSLIRTLKDHSGAVNTLVVLTDGNLASGSDDKTIKIWNSSNGSLIRTIENHFSSVNSLAVLQDGNLASCSINKLILIWNVDNGSLIRTIIDIDFSPINSLAVLPNGNLISIVDSAFSEKISISKEKSIIESLGILPKGKFVTGASSEFYKKIKIWNPDDASLVGTIDGNFISPNSLIVLSDGNIVYDSRSIKKFWF